MNPSADAPRPQPDARALITDWATGTIAQTGAKPTHLRVRIALLPGTDLVLGQLNVHVDDMPLRCQATAATAEDVGLLLISTLTRKLAHPGGDAIALFSHSVREHPPPAHPATITRRQQITPHHLSPGAAALWMIRHDYEAHLFLDEASGHIAAVHHDPHGGFSILHAGIDPTERHAAPILTEAVALAVLTETRTRTLFYTDQATGTGTLLYARYAGGYGLLTPLP